MARPQRCRCVCSLPSQDTFAPIDSACTDTIVMTIDEYEVIRLMDVVGLTQEQAAIQMSVGRTTVTGIYESARHKVAVALVEGKRLVIQGGKIKVCDRAVPVTGGVAGYKIKIMGTKILPFPKKKEFDTLWQNVITTVPAAAATARAGQNHKAYWQRLMKARMSNTLLPS